MKRLVVFVALLLSVAGAADAALLRLPPAQLSSAQAEELHRAGLSDPVLRVERDGRTVVIGFLFSSGSSEWAAAAYVWCSTSGTYVEVLVHRDGSHRSNITLPLATTFQPEDRPRLRSMIEALYAGCQTFSRAHAARAAATQAVPRTAATPRPVIPQTTYVKPTFLDRALLATSSPIAALWDEHRSLSILTFVFLGCLLGARARTRGPRPIVVRQDDVLAALAVSERRLSASRARLQQLSSAIDAEESQFIQRVSAIVERR